MLTSVVYFKSVSNFVELLHDLNVRRVYFHSFWAQKQCSRFPRHQQTPEEFKYNDCHCLAGLTSFANTFKLVVNGGEVSKPNIVQITVNQKLVGREFRNRWMSQDRKVRLVFGQVIDDRPPQSAWVPIDDFIAGVIPKDFPVVDYYLTQGVE